MKIAIINNLPHQYMGGIEKYSQLLIKMCIENNWEVHEFSIISPTGSPVLINKLPNVTQHDISFGARDYPFKGNKEIKNIVKNGNFDVVIGNSLANNVTESSDKYIQVQHMDNYFYSYKSGFRWFLACNAFFLGIGSPRNPMKSKNVMFYTKKHINPKSDNAGYAPLPLDPSFGWREEPKKGKYITWIARHAEPHKGLKNLNNIYELSKNKELFIVGGSGDDTNVLKIPDSQMVGSLSSDKVREHLDNSSVFIMTSNFEGFGFTIVEALSRGVPVVLYNTFTACDFFNDCPGVFVMDKKDHTGFAKQVDILSSMNPKEWKKISDSCLEFSKKKFDIKDFNKTWTNYIKTI